MKAGLAMLALVLGLTAQPALAQSMHINAIINGIGSVEYMDAVEEVHSAPAVRVIRLSSLAAAERSAARLEAKVAQQERAVYWLRSGLAINPIAMTALRNFGVRLDQVVSLSMAGDRATVLYVDDL